MNSYSRRAFLSLGTAGAAAAGAACWPLLSEGQLAAEALGKAGPGESPLVWLNSNENPHGPCPLAREAIARSIPQGGRYPYQTARKMAERLAALHSVPASMIVVGNGSSEVLRMAVGAFLAPGKTLVVPEPTYESPGRYAQVAGAAVKTVPLTEDFRHDTKAMAAAAAAAKDTGLVYACNPNNPTASLTPKEDMAVLVAALPPGAVLLVDEAYYHFVDSPAYESALRYVLGGKNVIVSRSFSKIYGLAGMRVGYGIGRADLIERMRRHALHLNTNLLGLEAALASLDDRDLVARNRERNARARGLVSDWLDRNRIRYAPTHANFLFLHTGKDINRLGAALWERGIAVGRPFPPFTDWMRVSVGTEDEMQRFLKAYEEVRASV